MMEKLGKTYTFNQTSVIALSLAGITWAITSMGGIYILGKFPASDFIPTVIMTIIIAILLPFYVLQKKWSYIAGIIITLISVVGLAFTKYSWYTFANPTLDFTFVLFDIGSLFFIYFAYKSYRKL